MTRNVLLASRDFSRLSSRISALNHAGFLTIRIRDLNLVLTLARFDCFQTLILDSTVTVAEQRAVIERLRLVSPRFHVICLRAESVLPQALVRECLVCEQEKSWGGVHLMDEELLPVAV
jgi:hypothetical protein